MDHSGSAAATPPPERTPRPRHSNVPSLRCFGFGMNFCYQLNGDEGAPSRYDTPLRLEWLENLRPSSVSSGSTFTYCVSERDKAVYRWGTQYGVVYAHPSQVELPGGSRAVSVACGANHTLILMEDSQVFSCGIGYFGQLGHGADVSLTIPQPIEALDPHRLHDRVVSASAGYAHSAVLTESGNVYLFGLNRSGQCAQDAKSMSLVLQPIPLANQAEVIEGAVVKVVCGRHHSAVLTEHGGVYTWGSSTFGSLGIHDTSKKVFTSPQRVTTLDPFQVQSIHSGDFHMLALTTDRRVFSWGYGAEGQGGHANALHLRTPRPVDALKHVLVSRLHCGAWYSSAISLDGYMYMWGYGDGGWLGQDLNKPRPVVEPGPLTRKFSETCSFDSQLNCFTPILVSQLSELQVSNVVCGGSHTIALAIARETVVPAKVYAHLPNFPFASPILIQASTQSDPISAEEQSPYFDASAGGDLDYGSEEYQDAQQEIEDIFQSMDPHTLAEQDRHAYISQVYSLCRHNRLEGVEDALKNGFDVNTQDANGNTLLIVAAQNGLRQAARLCIKYGADLNARNTKGNTALHYCFGYGHSELGAMLIKKGADDGALNSDGLSVYEGPVLRA